MLRKGWEWFYGFWKRCCQWSIGKQGELATMISIAFAIFSTLGVTGLILANALQNRNLYFMLIPFGVLFFLIAPVMVWKKEREKVLEFERVDLQLIVENDEQYIHQRGDNWIFRIGVKTSSSKTVNNVEVVVAKRNGKEHAYSDAPLRPAYSLPGDSASFSVKPDDIKFVEVCSWDKGSKEMRMHYHTSYQILLKYYDDKYKEYPYGLPPHISPFVLSNGIPTEHTITLCITGDNVRSVDKTLRLNTSREQPVWEEVNEQGTNE
jgi:hypothetical protein